MRSPTPPRHPADAALLRRAGRTVAVQTAAAVAVVVLLVALLVYGVALRSQGSEALTTVRNAAAVADDATDPPPGVLLVRHGPGGGPVETTPGTPARLADLAATARPGEAVERHVDGRSYLVYRVDRPAGAWVVAALDLDPRERERARLLVALLVSGTVGVVGAGVVGGLVGRRAVRPLGAALAVQRRFVADASHELRTPLTVVHTRAQMLAGRLGAAAPDLERSREDAARLVADSRSLADVVDDLLLAAELGHGVVPGDRVLLDRVVADVVATMREVAAERGVRLVHAPRRGDPAVLGVEGSLRRALSALVDNAVAHSPRGGAVLVSADLDGDRARLTVTDEGEGVDESQLDALTAPFARGTEQGSGADGERRRFGLGLALVSEVARAHGGRLSARGSSGRAAAAGSVFWIDLPLAE